MPSFLEWFLALLADREAQKCWMKSKSWWGVITRSTLFFSFPKYFQTRWNDLNKLIAGSKLHVQDFLLTGVISMTNLCSQPTRHSHYSKKFRSLTLVIQRSITQWTTTVTREADGPTTGKEISNSSKRNKLIKSKSKSKNLALIKQISLSLHSWQNQV